MADGDYARPRVVVTLGEARGAGLKRYFTGVPCKRGHVAERLTSNQQCMSCATERVKRFRDANPEAVKRQNARRDPEMLRLAARKYYWDNVERLRPVAKDRMRQRYQADPQSNIASVVRYRKRNLDKVLMRLRAWSKLRRQVDVQYRIATNLRNRLRRAVRMRGIRRQGSAVRDLGCSLEFFIGWLEQKFAPGMSWENYGPHWHIDHIVPLTAFDLTDPKQVKLACHYTNLQPLNASENIRKSGIRKKRTT